MFRVLKTEGGARRGEMETAHGAFQTPAFMNVATAGALRGGVSAPDVKDVGGSVLLCNTFHLYLRPGAKTVRALGGLHRFCAWQGPILTDSGGFQVFSMKNLRAVDSLGVAFISYLDGAQLLFTPEYSMQIQGDLGSDIAMAFDECVSLPCEKSYARVSAERTLYWLERCKRKHEELKREGKLQNPGQLLFGIGQGATYADLRRENMRQIVGLDLDGYAVGGLSVGEETPVMYEMLDAVVPEMPKEKIRYLMGVGTPVNILEATARGIDLFDCVLPLKAAQHGNVFTFSGRRRLLQTRYIEDSRPIEEGCDCPACRDFSRGYIRHLLKADERLGMRLCLLHNVRFYARLMEKIRESLDEGRFSAFYAEGREILGRMAQE